MITSNLLLQVAEKQIESSQINQRCNSNNKQLMSPVEFSALLRSLNNKSFTYFPPFMTGPGQRNFKERILICIYKAILYKHVFHGITAKQVIFTGGFFPFSHIRTNQQLKIKVTSSLLKGFGEASSGKSSTSVSSSFVKFCGCNAENSFSKLAGVQCNFQDTLFAAFSRIEA